MHIIKLLWGGKNKEIIFMYSDYFIIILKYYGLTIESFFKNFYKFNTDRTKKLLNPIHNVIRHKITYLYDDTTNNPTNNPILAIGTPSGRDISVQMVMDELSSEPLYFINSRVNNIDMTWQNDNNCQALDTYFGNLFNTISIDEHNTNYIIINFKIPIDKFKQLSPKIKIVYPQKYKILYRESYNEISETTTQMRFAIPNSILAKKFNIYLIVNDRKIQLDHNINMMNINIGSFDLLSTDKINIIECKDGYFIDNISFDKIKYKFCYFRDKSYYDSFKLVNICNEYNDKIIVTDLSDFYICYLIVNYIDFKIMYKIYINKIQTTLELKELNILMIQLSYLRTLIMRYSNYITDQINLYNSTVDSSKQLDINRYLQCNFVIQSELVHNSIDINIQYPTLAPLAPLKPLASVPASALASIPASALASVPASALASVPASAPASALASVPASVPASAPAKPLTSASARPPITMPSWADLAEDETASALPISSKPVDISPSLPLFHGESKVLTRKIKDTEDRLKLEQLSKNEDDSTITNCSLSIIFRDTDQKHKILLALRKDNKLITAGGMRESRETSFQCATRELKEEFGIIGITNDRIVDKWITGKSKSNLHYLVYLDKIPTITGPVLGKGGTDEILDSKDTFMNYFTVSKDGIEPINNSGHNYIWKVPVKTFLFYDKTSKKSNTDAWKEFPINTLFGRLQKYNFHYWL